MSVRKRTWRDRKGRVQEKWMVHIKHQHPDGTVEEIRKNSPVNTRRGAEQYERELREQLLAGQLRKEKTPASPDEAITHMTVGEFVDVFLREHSEVEGLRPRTISEQRRVLAQHIVPVVGDVPLKGVGSRHFGLVKRAMFHKDTDYSPKTINNVLGIMSRLVRFWWEHQEKDAPRFQVGLIRLDEKDAEVYEPEVYERLVQGAAKVGAQELAIVLLMGDAGLRQGEVRALQRGDLHFGDNPTIRVQRTRSKGGEEHPPKGKRNRTVPMTSRLATALRKHLKSRAPTESPHVFLNTDGKPLTQSSVRARILWAEREAGIEGTGRSHIMRHTFVTDLADNNTSPRVIQELAGHKDLKTTLRYMHLRDGVAHAAIRGLEQRHTIAAKGAEHIRST
jgi:integrase